MDKWGKVFLDEQKLTAQPALTVKFLMKNGLLRPKTPATLRWTSAHPIVGGTVEARWWPQTRSLGLYNKATGSIIASFAVVRDAGGRQHQTYLIDALTMKRARVLYCMGGQYGSREGFKLKFPSQRMTKADWREVEFQHPKHRDRQWPQLRDPQTLAPMLQPRVELDPWGTEGALLAAPEMSASVYKLAHEQFPRHLEAFYEAAIACPSGRPYPADHLEIGIFEQQPRLELFALRRANLLVDGELKVTTLSYDHPRSSLYEVMLYVDLRDAAHPLVATMNYFRRTKTSAHFAVWRFIRLTLPSDTPQRRRYFICPITGRRTDVLAFRESTWGSKAALRLINESQRSKAYGARIGRARVDAPPVRPTGVRR